MIILSGDIGGTNARLQLNNYINGEIKTLFSKTYLTFKFNTFQEVLISFFEDFSISRNSITVCCLAIAGVIKNNRLKFTNLNWIISEYELANFLNISVDRIKLINDFFAAGHGINLLKSQDIVCLQKGRLDVRKPIFLIGAGTGMGMAFINKLGNQTTVFSSEGGHQDFAPVDEEQINLHCFLKKKFGRTSIERVCSGPGLINIYEYISRKSLLNSNNFLNINNSAEDIISNALEKDPIASKAVDLFIQIYGSIVGNMALTFLPYGGLYLLGGIAPSLVNKFNDGKFIDSMTRKGRLSSILFDIPIYVVLDKNIGLKGTASYSLSLLNKK